MMSSLCILIMLCSELWLSLFHRHAAVCFEQQQIVYVAVMLNKTRQNPWNRDRD